MIVLGFKQATPHFVMTYSQAVAIVIRRVQEPQRAKEVAPWDHAHEARWPSTRVACSMHVWTHPFFYNMKMTGSVGSKQQHIDRYGLNLILSYCLMLGYTYYNTNITNSHKALLISLNLRTLLSYIH